VRRAAREEIGALEEEAQAPLRDASAALDALRGAPLSI